MNERIARFAPVLRGLLATPSGNDDDPHARVVLRWQGAEAAPPSDSDEPGVMLRMEAEDAAELNDEASRARLRAAIDAHTREHGRAPRVISVAGLGAFDVERADPTTETPLENKVALVTGAAGAIGAGICSHLLHAGCRVAATDVNAEALAELVTELDEHPGGRVTGIPLDVTEEDSVAGAFARVADTWGGVDIVVANAGIAAVSPLTELELSRFRQLERVNVEGTLLTLAEAARVMERQATGGDIVLISTKNVFAPGAQFGAYSATKAASHQLARIASLELAPLDIRVNMVAPDAVFGDGPRKSGLWAEVGPSRMQARGLDEQGLEDYYRSRNLLKARVTPAHVAKAVLFFVTRQTPTTGATIPVDGGLPNATPR